MQLAVFKNFKKSENDISKVSRKPFFHISYQTELIQLYNIAKFRIDISTQQAVQHAKNYIERGAHVYKILGYDHSIPMIST